MTLLIALTALGAWIGYPNPYWQFPPAALALPLGLAWIACTAATPRRALKLGWIAGSLAALGCVYWVYLPVTVYGGISWFFALPCPVLLAMALGVYFGLYAMIISAAARQWNGLVLCLLAGVLWAGMEMLAGSLFTGFPWMTLSAALAPWPVTVQGASLVGAYGLSGLLAMIAVSVVLWNASKSARYFGLALAAALLLFGWARVSAPEDADGDGPAVPVAVVQGNVDQSLKWDPAYQSGTVKKYLTLSWEAVAKNNMRVKPGEPIPTPLLVWPETAMPFYFQDLTPLRAEVSMFARANDARVLVGSPAYRTGVPGVKYLLHNRAMLLDEEGRPAGYYDKEHLVPFGEYMPLPAWLGMEKLVSGVGDFSPGKDMALPRSGDLALGMLICYEAIFPELAQRRVDEGANVLVNISNDAWFGRTSAPWQHLALASLRAVEQNRWLVRSTNTGISAFIDPRGRVVETTPQFIEAVALHDVRPIGRTTIFHRIHPVVRWSVILGCLAVLARILLAVRRGGDTTQTRE